MLPDATTRRLRTDTVKGKEKASRAGDWSVGGQTPEQATPREEQAVEEPEELGQSAHGPKKKANNKKKWGRGIPAAIRKKQQRAQSKAPMRVHNTAPKERNQVLQSCIQHGRVTEEQEVALSRAAANTWPMRPKQNKFGQTAMLLKRNKGAKKFLTLLFDCTVERKFNECNVEGYDRLTQGSPWLLKATETSVLHNDVYGQGGRYGRTIPGRHFHLWTLLYVVSATSPCQFCIYEKTGQRTKFTADRGDLLQTVNVKTGGKWILFPARLLHQMKSGMPEHERLIASIQFEWKRDGK